MTNVILLGDSYTGKSSWLHRLKGYKFTNTYIATMGKDTSLLKYNDRQVIIHDMGGQERFHTVVESYYTIADGAIIFFDASTEGRVDYWRNKLPKGIPCVVYGNKRDLLDDGYLDWVDVLSCKKDLVVTAPLDELLDQIPYLESAETTFLGWVWEIVVYYLSAPI